MSILLGGKYPPAPVPLWTPALITSLAWYDAYDPATIIESGGFVSQWNDKSGNLRHLTQGTGTSQPRTGVRTFNGKNVLDFDGGDHMSKSSFPAGLNKVSFFMVAQVDTIDNANDAIFCVSASKDMGLEAYNASQFNGVIHCVGASNPTYTPLSGGPFPGPSIYSMRYTINGFRIQGWVDGVIRADVGFIGGLSGSATLYVFADRNGTAKPDGAVAEFLSMSPEPSTEIRQKIEGYLAHKWGTTAKLPAGHPYKAAAPTA